MTNKDIARAINRLGKIMELHDENPFKIRSFTNAYITLRKLDTPLSEMDSDEIASIKGVGKTIVEKIKELIETGTLQSHEKFVSVTPPGIVEMLDIKGFGPKKIKTIWNQLEIETIGELLYACSENRLIELKGFGHKTQESLKKQLEYFINSKGKYHYASIIDHAIELENKIIKLHPYKDHSLCGAIRRMMPIVESLEIVTTVDVADLINSIEELKVQDGKLSYNEFPTKLYQVKDHDFARELFNRSASQLFLEAIGEVECAESEKQIFEDMGLAYIPSEYRESETALVQAQNDVIPNLITDDDLLGVIHNHSTYSDGLHTLKQMADYTKKAGYEYIVMSDHSKAAFYANGLNEDRCIQQMNEIDLLNKEYTDFRIFKSIECDILNDGSLDYDDKFLQSFDLVIASVHSNLRMDLNKATKRIIKAVEHPSTHILGHPTGRLLLSREGYPIDHRYIIDACVANNVVIELNANPVRLDIDWTWIPYLLERGGMISINPDAHNMKAIHHMKYGVAVARKGGLTRENCLNSKNIDQFEEWVSGLKN